MILRELLTKIGFNVDTKSLDTFNRSVKSAQSSIFAMGATITAAAGSIFALVKNVSNIGDEINKSSEELGISTDALQEWRYAADQAGISNDELATSIRMFSRNIGQAVSTGTGPFVDRMQQLGVALTDGTGKLKDNDTLLLEVADSLKNVKNASERGAIAQEFFGRSGLRMATFLSKGSAEVKLLRERAHELGLVLDNDTVNAAEEFNDRLSDVFQVVKAIKNQVGSALMPVMKEAALTFLDWSMINRDLIKQNLTKFLSQVIEYLKKLWEFGGKVSAAFEWFAKVCGSVENALIALAAAFFLIKLAPLIVGIMSLAGFMWRLFAGIIAVQAGVLLIPIGIALFITAILLALQELLVFFGVAKDGTDDVITPWETFKTAILGVFAAITIVRAIAFAKWIWGVAAAAWSAAGGAMALTAPFWVLIGLLAVIAYGAYKVYEAFQEMLGGFTFVDKLKAAWMLFRAWFGSFFGGMTDWVGKKFDAFIDGIISKVKWLTDKLKALNPFADEPSAARKDQSQPGSALAFNEEGNQNTRIGGIRKLFQGVANESQIMAATPNVAPGQIYTAGNNTNSSSTITNNRPVNVTSNVNVTLPPGTSGIQQEDVKNAVKAAWQEELQQVMETALFNNTEYE